MPPRRGGGGGPKRGSSIGGQNSNNAASSLRTRESRRQQQRSPSPLRPLSPTAGPSGRSVQQPQPPQQQPPQQRQQQQQHQAVSSNRFAADRERGQTRSGARFAARNLAYHTSIASLMAHHQRLLLRVPEVSTQYAEVGRSRGTLMQTTLRFRADHPNIREDVRRVFGRLFREHTDGNREGFEVVTTFNVILSNTRARTYSLFYGHDYRGGRMSEDGRGAHGNLVYGSSALVTSPDDVAAVPTTFDLDGIVNSLRHAFSSSDVQVVQIVNIVYLIYQFRDGRRRPAV